MFEKVGEFNECFRIPERQSPSCHIVDDDKFLYKKLLEEENEEYMDAIIHSNTVKVADALIDELYVVIGALRKHGFTYELTEKLFNEVHSSNMSKTGEDGKPIFREDGKVLKGPNYFKPKIEDILDS